MQPQVTRRARRKWSFLEIMANIIIWVSPLLVMGLVLAFNWDAIVVLETKYHFEFWFSFALFIIMFVYYCVGKKRLKERLTIDKQNEEKTRPVFRILDTLFALIPFVLGMLLIDWLMKLGSPIFKIMLVITLCETFGRLLLCVDSFRESEYKC